MSFLHVSALSVKEETMDNPSCMPPVTDAAAAFDYTAIHTMLQSCIDFKYSQVHILSDGLIKLIIVELEYWHNLAERLLKEKVTGE